MKTFLVIVGLICYLIIALTCAAFLDGIRSKGELRGFRFILCFSAMSILWPLTMAFGMMLALWRSAYKAGRDND